MLLAKTLRSSTFRLALIAIAAFGLIVAAIMAYVYFGTLAYVRSRVGDAGFSETPRSQLASVASPTRSTIGGRVIATQRHGEVDAERATRTIRVVTALRDRVVDAELEPAADDALLRELHQRRMDLQPLRALDAGLRGQVGHPLEGLDVLRPAIRIPAVVERVDTHEHVARAQRLGIRKRERQEDRVAGGHVGDRDLAVRRVEWSVLRYRDVVGQRRRAERA